MFVKMDGRRNGKNPPYPWIVYICSGIPHGRLIVEDHRAVEPLREALGVHAHLFRVRLYEEFERVPGQVVVGYAGQVLVGDEGTASTLEFALANPHDLDGGLMRVVVELSKYGVPGDLLEILVEKFKRFRRQLKWRDDEIKSRDDQIRWFMSEREHSGFGIAG